MANDLLDAVIEQLRATPAVVSAFADTWNPTTQTGVSKFYADYAGDVALPYLVIFETGETYRYMTNNVAGFPSSSGYPFIADGQFGIVIYQGGRYACRQLGALVANSLNDASITWPADTLMEFRAVSASFIPVTDIGPQTPSVFKRLITFDYDYSGSII